MRQGNYKWLLAGTIHDSDYQLETSFCAAACNLAQGTEPPAKHLTKRKVLKESKNLDEEHRVELTRALEEMPKN
jgi:hypothetical protein